MLRRLEAQGSSPAEPKAESSQAQAAFLQSLTKLFGGTSLAAGGRQRERCSHCQKFGHSVSDCYTKAAGKPVVAPSPPPG